MPAEPRKDLGSWVRHFAHATLPVLARTITEIGGLAADEERASPIRISEVVLHDPLMTLKVLRFIQERRHARQTADITTIAHALMMLGNAPFFRHFSRQDTLQQKLAGHPRALEGALRVISRARHAALYARHWALARHDLEIDEVVIAALLHDLAELLLWCFAPELALAIGQLQRKGRIVRSESAQRAVLGFPLVSLQLALCEQWNLPRLLPEMMNDHDACGPRARMVVLATALARHSAHGWDDPALPDDYAAIGRLLGVPAQEARRCVLRVALEAARDWDWYGVAPAATLLPLISEPRIKARIPACSLL